jgi:hypothetical protein
MFTALSTILGLVMALSGSSKLQAKPMAVAAAEKLSYTGIMKQVGALELLLGVIAVSGNSLGFIPDGVHQASVLGIAFVMAGAVMFHLRAKDVKGAVIPLIIGLLAIVALSAEIQPA